MLANRVTAVGHGLGIERLLRNFRINRLLPVRTGTDHRKTLDELNNPVRAIFQNEGNERQKRWKTKSNAFLLKVSEEMVDFSDDVSRPAKRAVC